MKGLMAAVIASLALVSGGLTLTNSMDSSVIPFECEDVVEGDRVEVNDRTVDGGVERRLEIRVEADSRVRIEARSELREEDAQSRREARVELCGFVEFADADGDGVLDADEVVRETLAVFEAIEHTAGDPHVFAMASVDGSLSVTASVPASHPADDESLIAWSAEGNLACGPDATHYALRLEQSDPVQLRTFFVAECGTTLTASGGV